MKFPRWSWILVLVAAGCRERSEPGAAAADPVPLAGQIFTIRRDGVNLPLGGVEVSWVSADRMRRELARIRQRAPRIEALLAYESTLRDVEDRLAAARADRRAGKLLEPFVGRADWILRRSRGTFEQNEDIESLLESPRFARNHASLFEGSGFENDVQAHWMLVHLFVARLEAIRSVSTISDAAGNFRFELPAAEPGCLLAHARTSALGEEHHDYWLVSAGMQPRSDLVLSPRLRLLPYRFREWRGEFTEAANPPPPDLQSLYGLPALEPVSDALSHHSRIVDNLDRREHLGRRIAALREELSEWVKPEAP